MIKIYLRYNVFKLLFAFFCINNFVETKAVKTPGKPIFKGKSRQLNKVQQYKGKRIKCEYCSNFISDMGWNKVRHWARKHPKETGHLPEVKKALETSEKSYVCEKCPGKVIIKGGKGKKNRHEARYHSAIKSKPEPTSKISKNTEELTQWLGDTFGETEI